MILLRTIAADPMAGPHLEALLPNFAAESEALAKAWADAQLAADASLLGNGVGVRVCLLPIVGLWYADVIVIQSRSRIRLGAGSAGPLAALRTCHRRLVASVADMSAARRDPPVRAQRDPNDAGDVASNPLPGLTQVHVAAGRRSAQAAPSGLVPPSKVKES